MIEKQLQLVEDIKNGNNGKRNFSAKYIIGKGA